MTLQLRPDHGDSLRDCLQKSYDIAYLFSINIEFIFTDRFGERKIKISSEDKVSELFSRYIRE